MAQINVRLRRLSLGNPGDVRPVGEGVSELRIDYGPGYRVYFVRRGIAVTMLLCGGDKRIQKTGISPRQSGWRFNCRINVWLLKTIPWDAADHLTSAESIAAYLDAALEDGDPDLIRAALGDVARAKGMTEIAEATGLSRTPAFIKRCLRTGIRNSRQWSRSCARSVCGSGSEV